MAMFLASCFSYNIAGRQIGFNGPENRDQALLPFGFSLMWIAVVVYLSRLFISETLKKSYIFIITVFSTGLFTTVTFLQYVDGIKSWFVQQALLHDMKEFAILRDGGVIAAYDDNIYQEPWHSSLRFYYLSALSQDAFDHQRNMLLAPSDTNVLVDPGIDYYLSDTYHCRDVQLDGMEPSYILYNYDNHKIERGSFLARLVLMKLTNTDDYHQMIDDISELKIKPLKK
jgi:hypothetical protein